MRSPATRPPASSITTGLMRAWVGTHDVEGRPLVKYIRSSFHAVQTIGDYQFMIRNERGLPQ